MRKKLALLFMLVSGSCAPVPAEIHDEESLWVAATLILEAGGESAPFAMEAVYEVLHKRATRRGTTPYVEAFRRKQFSCWNNVEKRETLFRHAKAHPKFKRALQIVNSSTVTNHTNGADHYHATYVNPYWASTLVKTVSIGNHIFYK